MFVRHLVGFVAANTADAGTFYAEEATEAEESTFDFIHAADVTVTDSVDAKQG